MHEEFRRSNVLTCAVSIAYDELICPSSAPQPPSPHQPTSCSLRHCIVWNEISQAVASAFSGITLMLNLLVAGIGCKQMDLNPPNVDGREQTLATLAIMQLISVITHFGMVNVIIHGQPTLEPDPDNVSDGKDSDDGGTPRATMQHSSI